MMEWSSLMRFFWLRQEKKFLSFEDPSTVILLVWACAVVNMRMRTKKIPGRLIYWGRWLLSVFFMLVHKIGSDDQHILHMCLGRRRLIKVMDSIPWEKEGKRRKENATKQQEPKKTYSWPLKIAVRVLRLSREIFRQCLTMISCRKSIRFITGETWSMHEQMTLPTPC